MPNWSAARSVARTTRARSRPSRRPSSARSRPRATCSKERSGDHAEDHVHVRARTVRGACTGRATTIVNALVHRAARGEERAWTLLVGRFDATVRSLARRYGLNDADRDEVAQRTWLALFRHIERLTTHPALAGWLITTARNECLRVIAVAQAGGSRRRADRRARARPAPHRRRAARGRAARGAAARGRRRTRARAKAHALAAAGTAAELRRDQRQARHPEGQHRPDPRSVSGSLAR